MRLFFRVYFCPCSFPNWERSQQQGKGLSYVLSRPKAGPRRKTCYNLTHAKPHPLSTYPTRPLPSTGPAPFTDLVFSSQARPNLARGLLGNVGQEHFSGTHVDFQRALQSPEHSARHKEEPPPPSLRACAQKPGTGGGREPGGPAARCLPSPALYCSQGGGSALRALNTPPPPQTEALTLLSLDPSDLTRSCILPLNCSRIQRRRPNSSLKDYKCCPIHSVRDTSYLNLETVSLQLSLFSPFANSSLWTQDLNMELSPAPSATTPGKPRLLSRFSKMPRIPAPISHIFFQNSRDPDSTRPETRIALVSDFLPQKLFPWFFCFGNYPRSSLQIPSI